MSFDVGNFVERCTAAVGAADAPDRIAAILRKAISDPDAIADAIRQRENERGSPSMADVFVNSDELTIYHVAFPPNLYGAPHDHAGWAVIGVYKGAECFNVYREEAGRLMRVGRQVMNAPSVEILNADLIHDIENPAAETSGSIHVYGNRHFHQPNRRIWRDGNHVAEPFTMERSFAYGMERTNRIRRELGMEDAEMPDLPALGRD